MSVEIDQWLRKKNRLDGELTTLCRLRNDAYNYGIGVYKGFWPGTEATTRLASTSVDVEPAKHALLNSIANSIAEKQEEIEEHEARITVR